MRALRLLLCLAPVAYWFAIAAALAPAAGGDGSLDRNHAASAAGGNGAVDAPKHASQSANDGRTTDNGSANQTATIVELDEDHLTTGRAAVGPLFQDLHFRYTGRGWRNRLIRYRLFVPDDLTPPKKYPMIVWLHGHADGGNNNALLLNHLDSLIFFSPWHRGQFPFFFLAVECPADNPYWTTTDPNADDMNNVVLAAMDRVIAAYPVDRARVSLAGLSSGGTGVWDLAMRAPERYSAVAPMASSGGDTDKVNRLVHVPVWAFHCSRDLRTSPRGDRQTVAALKAAGGQAWLTEINSADHDCWHDAFLDYDLLDWLLYQRRGEVSDYPPGKITFKNRLKHFGEGAVSWLAPLNPLQWRPWQYAVQLGIPLLLVIGYLSARRQRRKRAAAGAQ